MVMRPSGASLRKQFTFDDGYIPLNHGSFGACPSVVRDAMVKYDEEEEKNPDLWLRFKFYPLLRESREAIAKLVNADPSSIVFVPNATTAINTVLRSLKWEEGDVILTYNTIYSGVDKTVEYIVESTPVQTEMLDFHWPISDDDLVTKFGAGVTKINSAGGRRVRMAILDTVTSNPGLKIPYERLTHKCREHGVLSLVDGAHGVGQIPLDLTALDADFFTSNVHKWLYVPRGCAFLQVPQRNQHLIRSSLPTSHGFQPLKKEVHNPLTLQASSAFQALFEFMGTMNSNNWLTIPIALEFRERVCGGEEAIMAYCIDLARRGGDRAAEILGTDVLDNREGSLRNCAFANVRLPLQVETRKLASLGEVSRHLMKQSVERGTFLAVGPYNGVLYWRISAQCYLDMGNIEWGARLMKELCEQAEQKTLQSKEPIDIVRQGIEDM